MRSFGAPSLLLAAIVLVSLAAKVWVAGPEPEDSNEDYAVTAASSLQAAGFQARLVRLPRSPGVVTIAELNSCRILAGPYPAHSTFRDVWHNLAAPIGPLRFAWRDQLYDREPKLGGLFDYYRWRELMRVGIRTERSPVIAVVANAGCSTTRLPWQPAG